MCKSCFIWKIYVPTLSAAKVPGIGIEIGGIEDIGRALNMSPFFVGESVALKVDKSVIFELMPIYLSRCWSTKIGGGRARSPYTHCPNNEAEKKSSWEFEEAHDVVGNLGEPTTRADVEAVKVLSLLLLLRTKNPLTKQQAHKSVECSVLRSEGAELDLDGSKVL